MILVAYFVDRRTKKDYAFWLYLFGGFSFWFGLRVLIDDWKFWKTPEARPILGEMIYLSTNVFFMIIAILLQRRVLMVFASIGVFSYISIIEAKILSVLPSGIKHLLPRHRFER